MKKNYNFSRSALFIALALLIVSLTSFSLILFHSGYLSNFSVSNNSSLFPITENIYSYLPNPSTQVAALTGANSGLVGWWKLDEGSGTSATDSSGSGNNGALLKGPIWTTDRAAVAGQAVQFSNVVGQGIVIPDSATLNPAQITISFWMKVPDTTGTYRIIDKTNGFVIRSSGGYLQMIKGIFLDSTVGYQANTWENWTFTGGTDQRWYRNGVLAGVSNTPWTGTTYPGYDIKVSGSVDQFTGAIDDVRIYSRALGADEVLSLAQNAIDPPPANPPPNPPPLDPPPIGNTVGNIYVSQNSSGNNSGSDCSNAHSAAWFNTPSNWGATAGLIFPGTTVHLCGVISTQLSVKASGSTNAPITIFFEPNSKISLPVCKPYGCLDIDNNDFISVNGGTNGIIENTANGTYLANQSGSSGITYPGNNVTIENLTIQNIYVHASMDDDNGAQTYCIYIYGSHNNIKIRNNTFHDARWCVGLNGSNIEFSGNNVYRVDHGIYMGGNGSNINIFNNHFHDYDNWDDQLSVLLFHHNAIHIWGSGASNSIMSNVNIYNNLFDGVSGHTTSLIFVEMSQTVNDFSIFNNVFNSTSPDGNGVVGLYSYGRNVSVMNNTIIGVPPMGTVAGSCLTINYFTNVLVKNNVMANCGILFGLGGSATFAPANIDNNAYANFTYGTGWAAATTREWYNKIADWQNAKGVDIHSTYKNAFDFMNSAGVPVTNSSVIGAGANLYSVCLGQPNPGLGALCSDKSGKARPSSGAWDIGAYYVGGQTSGNGNGGQTSANYNPTDTSHDSRITLSEIQAYTLCWKTSGCIWNVAPNPILQTYLNMAAFIYKSGELYHYDSNKICPSCYVKGL